MKIIDNTASAITTESHLTPHEAFRFVRSQTIDSLNLTIAEYEHINTGALHYHLASDKTENVFIVAFRTVPTDSTGVAHVLEHTVLCGSERYPVRDPFFMMIRRSLNTFMNAFTSSDWTAYPFASKNRKDYFNLLDVYLDAVFFSNLNELDFKQEGHRVEFATPDDPTSNLVYKGVVFNEMKGAMSSATSTLWQTLTQYLFPTTTYHYNSGGDPVEIPKLTYNALKEFYRTHYHPSNAVFMTYGDLPVRELQNRFEQSALHRFQRLDAHISVEDEQRMTAPIAVEETYALDESEQDGDKTHVVMGWLLGSATDLYTSLTAELLSGVLLDDSASPLRHALETSDLGASPSPLCGLDNSNKEMTFACGMEGSTPEKAEAIEALILSTLEKVASEGVAPERVESVLHQLELEQREVGGNSYPYGLQLILEALPTAIHYGDTMKSLDLDPALEKLRQDIKDPDYFSNLIRSQLLDNPHRVRLTLKPDTELAAKRDADEAAKLAEIKAKLTDSEKQQIVELAEKLKERQNQEDDESILPKVGLEDVPEKLDIAVGEKSKILTHKATLFDQGTNGLVYQQYIADLPALDDDHLAILPYYTHCLTELGCGDQDYLTLQARQSSVSGGIGAYTNMRGATDSEQKVKGHFVMSGKALARQHRDFGELFHEIFQDVRFDEHVRIRELMAQMRTRRERSITGQGHSLAMRAASAGMSPSAALRHRLSGLAGISNLKKLDDTLNESTSLNQLADRMRELHSLIQKSLGQFLFIGEADSLADIQQDCSDIWKTPKPGDLKSLTLPTIREQVKEMWITSTSVNFCAKSFPTVTVDHPDSAALTVLGGFLRNGYLHRAIREQGGAYGGGATHDSESACFNFFSYRDPRLTETLEDFDRSIDWLLSSKHEWSQVEEAILGVIGSLDKPSSPEGEARDAFFQELYGRTPDQRQQQRHRILGVTLADLQRVGEKYLTGEHSTAVVTCSQNQEIAQKLGLNVRKL
jgi:Zn-dependent M16 (insulinase) family peptidase